MLLSLIIIVQSEQQNQRKSIHTIAGYVQVEPSEQASCVVCWISEIPSSACRMPSSSCPLCVCTVCILCVYLIYGIFMPNMCILCTHMRWIQACCMCTVRILSVHDYCMYTASTVYSSLLCVYCEYTMCSCLLCVYSVYMTIEAYTETPLVLPIYTQSCKRRICSRPSIPLSLKRRMKCYPFGRKM